MEGLGTRAKCGFQSCQINVSLHITSGYCIYIEITFAEFVCRSKYKKACILGHEELRWGPRSTEATYH